jgi:hypothetical protein
MRQISYRILFATLLVASPATWAQMHKVAKPEQVVRAVGVFEWTGDFAKPTASRLIPVSLFIEGKLEDAGVYVARPVPFALLSGNVYELQSAGVDKGFLDLAYARHLQATTSTGDLAYDDGWFGYGSVKPLAIPRKAAALKPSKTVPVLTSSANGGSHPQTGSKSSSDTSAKSDTASTSDDPDRPTMKRRSSDTANSGTTTPPPTDTTSKTSTPADDPDRPTMKRRSDSTTTDSSTASPGSTTSAGSTPADDPDRPTMKRKSDSSDTSTTPGSTASTPADDPDRPTMQRRTSDTADNGSTTASGNPPANDPDRPTLKRHSAEEAKKAHDTNSVAGTGSLNDDPNRPNLHHGKPTSAMTETDLPKLTGLPQNLHQMVAVSDAANRDVHPFTLEWDDATQHAAILAKMQAMARAQLAAYASTPGTVPPAPVPAAKKATTTRAHRTTAPIPAPMPLLDEELKAYTLSYGGAATYIYSAHTTGTGAALRYVTIVAQDNGLGELKPAIQSVTDAAHLDRTPLLRFVDVVDAEASNRASLLFELRSQNARQFGLYRVIASHSEQIFLTGTTQ